MTSLKDGGLLGMNADITRRDFMGGTLAASGAALMTGACPFAARAKNQAEGADWTGYGGVGEYARSNGNVWDVVKAGHGIRDGAYDLENAIHDLGETVDCVIVGGGISGLAAALTMRRRSGGRLSCLVLENHAIFGGEARQNLFEVEGRRLVAQQGSALFFVPYPYSSLARFYDSIGLGAPRLRYQEWGGPDPAMEMAANPYDSVGIEHGQYGFWFADSSGASCGRWVLDPIRKGFAGAPVSNADRADLLRWFSGKAAEAAPFTGPAYEGDEISRRLDAISLEQHYMERYGLTRDFIRTYLSPVEGGGSGLGPDALSAYCDYGADLLRMDYRGGDPSQMFPGGNTTIARLMVKALIDKAFPGEASVAGVSRDVDFAALDAPGEPARIRCGATVVSVRHEGDPASAGAVSVIYAKDGRLFRLRARSAIMAGGSWTAKHIIADLPDSHREAYGQFYRSPCLIANVALRNWRFLYRMGLSGCRWFGGFGSALAVRKVAVPGGGGEPIGPDSPVVVTLKILFPRPGLSTQEQGILGRTEMFSTSFREYEHRIREQFTALFGRWGFDARRDIAGIILNRWGHAYLSPQPGFFFGKDGAPSPRDVLRAAPFGRIAFANTDLAGIMDHRCSILEAERAAGQLLDSVLI